MKFQYKNGKKRFYVSQSSCNELWNFNFLKTKNLELRLQIQKFLKLYIESEFLGMIIKNLKVNDLNFKFELQNNKNRKRNNFDLKK